MRHLRWALALVLVAAACTASDPLGSDELGVDTVEGALHEGTPNQVLIQWRPGASEQDKEAARNRGAAQRLEHVADHANGELELATVPPGLSVADAVRGLGADPAVAF